MDLTVIEDPCLTPFQSVVTVDFDVGFSVRRSVVEAGYQIAGTDSARQEPVAAGKGCCSGR